MKAAPALGFFLLVLGSATVAPAQTLEWVRQFGTDSQDISYALAADALGNVYTSGETGGDLGSQNQGDLDRLLSKHDADGALLWHRQTGTIDTDSNCAVTVDTSGYAYTAGSVWGDPYAGGVDVVVNQYSPQGGLVWSRQFGSASDDQPTGISSDGSASIYVTGYTFGSLAGSHGGEDAFIRKYRTDGSTVWTLQFGSSDDDFAKGISADALGNVYVAGWTWGSLEGTNAGGGDAFIRMYDSDGGVQWTRQFGTSSYEEALSVSADGLGNCYVVGRTGGDLEGTNAGQGDAFIRMYDTNGNLRWTRQFGTSSDDQALSVSADGAGNVYVSGETGGDLAGTSAGGADAFVGKYDENGTLLWMRQLGTSSNDSSYGVSPDRLGNVYIAGKTRGSFTGTNAGWDDIFLAKFTTVPEPSSFALAVLTVAGLLLSKRHGVARAAK